MKTKNLLSINLAVFGAMLLAKPPVNPINPNNPLPLEPTQPLSVVSGSLMLTNCNALSTDVVIRMSSGKSVQPNSRQLMADGRIKMSYRFVFPAQVPIASLSVSASLRQGVCSGGVLSPASVAVNRIPSVAPAMSYTVQAGHVYRIKGVDLARSLDTTLASMKMKLNNYKSQSSFIELLGFNLPFQVQRTVVDIDCGTLCPDLGDGQFYLNDIKLKSSDVSFDQSALKFKFNFEDDGREIKGIHNKLGDNGMPDFQMDKLSLSVKAYPRLSSQSKMVLGFYGSDLDADINSTGGCNLGGVDLCNKIFGTDRKIQKGVELAATSALNSSVVQAAVTLGVERYLTSIGATTEILSVQVYQSEVIIATR